MVAAVAALNIMITATVAMITAKLLLLITAQVSCSTAIINTAFTATAIVDYV